MAAFPSNGHEDSVPAAAPRVVGRPLPSTGPDATAMIRPPVSRANISAISGQQASFFFSESMTDDDLLCFIFELSRNLREENRRAVREANGITASGILIPPKPSL